MPQNRDLSRERVRFERRQDTDDGYGNTVSDWLPQFERPAQFIMRPGSEAVTAARLEGRQPIKVIVRYDTQTSTVTPDWRLVDLNGNRVLAIVAADDMDRQRRWWTMECLAGSPA
jgi:SPP1 family predicted phage head-tail adaptor